MQLPTFLCYLFLTLFLNIQIHVEAKVITIRAEEEVQTKFQQIQPTPDEELLKQDKMYWLNVGKETLDRAIKFAEEEKKHKKAKNVIIFIGDGMGISTITAARIYKGQRKFEESGEEHNLVYDNFPNVALVKTYNVDMQVPDSAGTATALFTGVKTRYEAIGLDVNCNQTIFDKDVYEDSKVDSLMVWAQAANKSTGIVTTTRITHATPAGTYAHVNHRDWECDAEVPEEVKPYVKDIARQLIEDEPGKNLKVILGGGQQLLGHYTPMEVSDLCIRNDSRNLTKIWTELHEGTNYVLATNNEQLQTVNDDTEYLLGAFAADHLEYELLRETGPEGTPSLTEMVQKALQVLKKDENGFVLVVEGGKIDLAHHENYARLSMAEVDEFDNAVSLAVNETDDDTLILVTADHSHSFTLQGYSERGNDILGYTLREDFDEEWGRRPFLTLAYANGPAFGYHFQNESSNETYPWRDVRTDPNLFNNPKYAHIGAFETEDATHGGEDVAVFAKGPNAYLVRGVVEQNYIAHIASYSGCFGPVAEMNPACEGEDDGGSMGVKIQSTLLVVMIFSLLTFMLV